MHQRQLGSTGLLVSVLGLGSSPFRHGTPDVCARLVSQAIDLGVNYYDTARSYVNGEEAVGAAPASVRNRLVVATKTGARGGPRCVRDLEQSLRMIRRPYLDVWMTHMVETEQDYRLCTELGGFCDIASAARQAGLVRATGASFHAPTPLIRRAIEERAFDVVMFQLNLIGRETVLGSSIRSYRETLLPLARSTGVGVVVMKALAGGELRDGAPFVQCLQSGRDGAEHHLATFVRYPTLNPAIATTVVGMATTHQLLANVAAVEGVGDAGQDQFDAWSAYADGIAAGPCTRCGACVGSCPQDIEIPKVFRLHDQLRYFGMGRVAREKYRAMAPSAEACTSCGACESVCPERLDVPALLHESHSSLAAES